ncbi:MAG TPA: ROK family protein [Chitinophagaceae bacterium]
MDRKLVAGVDIGGSHITVALVEPVTKRVIECTRKRRDIDASADAGSLLDQWSSLIKKSFAEVGKPVSEVGVAMPGPFDYERGISFIQGQKKFDKLYGLNIKNELAERLGIDEDNIAFTNDAECYLRGEVVGGAGSGCSRLIGLTIGTGLGSAIAINGEVKDADLWRSNFKDSIAEEYLSARWFLRRYTELTGNEIKDVKQLAMIGREDSCAESIFIEFGINLGAFLLPRVTMNNLEMVVLGGNIAKSYSLFSSSLGDYFAAEGIKVDVKTAGLWEDAALIGGASRFFAKENVLN